MAYKDVVAAYRAIPRSERDWQVCAVMEDLYLLHMWNEVASRPDRENTEKLQFRVCRANNILSNCFEALGTPQERFAFFPAVSEFLFGDDDYTDPEIQVA
jgi:hypothetical protein